MNEEKKVIYVGYMEQGYGKHQSNCVYDTSGLCPTICAGLGVKMQGIFFLLKDER